MHAIIAMGEHQPSGESARQRPRRRRTEPHLEDRGQRSDLGIRPVTRPLPSAHRAERVLLDRRRRRPTAHPGMPQLPGADPPARARSAGTAAATTWACARFPAGPRSSAFTVNHRFGFPDLPPPYVVAQVAIVEDPRVRLTTNIVECDPDDARARASPSRCVFQQLADVWLPVFKPSADATPRPHARRRDRAAGLRQARPADAHARRSSRTTRRSPASARPGSAAG